MKKQTRAYLFALGAVALWSTVASAFKVALRHLTPVELLFYASLFSCLVLAAYLVVTGRLAALRAFTRRQALVSVGLGLLNPFLYYLVLFEAYDRLPAQEAQPLNYTWAVALAFLSVPLLGHRLRIRDVVAAVICYGGALVISTHGDVLSFRLSDALGVGLALGSALVWALYWIGNTRSDRDPAAGLFLSFLASLPFSAAVLLAAGLRWPTWQGLAGGAYAGVFEMGLTFLLWLTALKLTESTARVSNLIFLSPFLSLVLIHFVVGEDILPSSVLGLALIVAGLLWQSLGGKSDRMAPPTASTDTLETSP